MTEPSCFLLIEGPDRAEGRRVPLGPDSTVIGRDEAADVEIDDPKLSRRHAAFRVIDGHPYVEDLGSVNGVKIRGRRIDERRRLRDGDRLRLGGTLIRVQASDLPPPTTSLGPRLLGPELELPLTKQIWVGRGPDCQLRSDEATVSPLHARIDPEPPAVHDLGSAHGVYVNDVRVRWSELRDGDELRFGRLGFEVEIPTGPAGPRAALRWRSPWPRRIAMGAAGTGLVILLFVLGEVGGGRNGSPLEQPGPQPSVPVQPRPLEDATPSQGAAAPAPQSQPSPTPQSEPSQAPEATMETVAPREPASLPSAPRAIRAPPPAQRRRGEDQRFDAPRSWQSALESYFRGEVEAARERARDPALVAWLEEAEARHARALTEVSNDLERAKVLLDALARSERQVHDQPSAMRRDLRTLLGAAFAERGERSLEQAQGGEAYRQLAEARALAPEHPRVEGLSRRVEAAARRRARQAELWSRSGDRRACRAWRDVVEMTRPDSPLGRSARLSAERTCS